MRDDDQGDKPRTTVDPDRKAILRRRQQFIALALSGLALTAGTCRDNEPQPCLSQAIGDTATDAKVCLEVQIPEVDTEAVPCLEPLPPPDSTDPNADRANADPRVPTVPEPAPRPCLKPRLEPPIETRPLEPPAPQVCLSVMRVQPPPVPPPEDKEGTEPDDGGGG